MKTQNFFRYLVAAVLVIALGFSSCIEPVEEVDHYKIMTDYMKANNMDLNNMTTTWTVDANVVNANPADFYVLDLRSATDYANGHIQGAVNVPLTGVVAAAANAGTKQLVVACYTGQTAALANVALRLSGYPSSKILKWGMSSWMTATDRWTANISDRALSHANWSATNTIKAPVVFETPKFTASSSNPAEILAERVALMLEKGYGAMALPAATVLDDPNSYFINNYWTEQNVADHGHIKGAYRILENLTLANDGFKYLDPNATIVTYCWTGQTSALVSAYLTVLGYQNAKTIGFGCNALINSTLKANKWSSSIPGNYSLAK